MILTKLEDFVLDTYDTMNVQVVRMEQMCVELEGKAHEQHTVATDYAMGEYVFESTVDDATPICQVISAANTVLHGRRDARTTLTR